MKKIPKKLIIIGDSSVYGWGDKDSGGWCERLRRSFMNFPNAPVIYSLGIRGDGLEKVAQRWKQEWICRGEIRRKYPDAILLSIGLNDTARIGSHTGRPQLSSEAYYFGISQLLTEIKIKNNIKIFILGLTPINEDVMPFADCLWYSNKACELYESKMEEACLELDIPFLPTFKMLRKDERWKNFIEPDGIHLNSHGHYWIYSQMLKWKALLEWAELETSTTLTST
tara:strand:- start:364 stop:1041 length:678 start_codon:yes stop_codon:yes gene_type:complete